MAIDHLGFSGIKGFTYSTGLGYVIIPESVDRDKFVQRCFSNGEVSIVRDLGSFGIINKVKVSPEILQTINFPEKPRQLGDCVAWVLEQKTKRHNIVARIPKNDQVGFNWEGRHFIAKEMGGKSVLFSMDAKNGSVQLLAYNSNVEIASFGDDSKTSLFSQGEVTVKGNKAVRTSSNHLIEAKIIKDDKVVTKTTLTEDFVKHEAEKIIHNKGETEMLRAKETLELLSNLIDLLFNSRVPTAIGLQPLTNFIEINALKKRLESLKSKKSFLE